MAAKGKTSKLARALEKDLQGEQVVYRNFQEGKISILKDNRDRYYSAAVSSFRAREKVWKALVPLLLVTMSIFLYLQQDKGGGLPKPVATWLATAKSMVPTLAQVTDQAPVNDAKIAHPQTIPAKIRTGVPEGVETSGTSPCMLRKSSYGTRGFSFDRELQFARNCLGAGNGSIYSWNDRQGITHFSTTGFPEKEYFSPNWVKY